MADVERVALAHHLHAVAVPAQVVVGEQPKAARRARPPSLRGVARRSSATTAQVLAHPLARGSAVVRDDRLEDLAGGARPRPRARRARRRGQQAAAEHLADRVHHVQRDPVAARPRDRQVELQVGVDVARPPLRGSPPSSRSSPRSRPGPRRCGARPRTRPSRPRAPSASRTARARSTSCSSSSTCSDELSGRCGSARRSGPCRAGGSGPSTRASAAPRGRTTARRRSARRARARSGARRRRRSRRWRSASSRRWASSSYVFGRSIGAPRMSGMRWTLTPLPRHAHRRPRHTRAARRCRPRPPRRCRAGRPSAGASSDAPPERHHLRVRRRLRRHRAASRRPSGPRGR